MFFSCVYINRETVERYSVRERHNKGGREMGEGERDIHNKRERDTHSE